MAKKDTTMTAEGTIARRDGVTEIEAETWPRCGRKCRTGISSSPCGVSERQLGQGAEQREEEARLLGVDVRV